MLKASEKYLAARGCQVVSHFRYVVAVASSPHQSPRCGVCRVEKVWKFWLPTMSAGNPAVKRQLPFGSISDTSLIIALIMVTTFY